MSHRLSEGGLIDRAKPVRFTFDGRSYQGYEGDTLASALLASGVRLFGRSFKYHRPRGVLTAGGEEPNALVTLRTGARAEPNCRATSVPLFDGLEASSQNRWPSLRWDVLAVNQLAAPLFVAGFYYKTFMWPAGLWEKLYEPLIRRAAGLGTASGLPDPDSYDRDHGFCDLLVIGGGPAGLMAALAAGRAGLRVILADDGERPGGGLLGGRHEIDGTASWLWAEVAAHELEALPNVRLLTRTSVFGIYDGGEYGAVERLSDHLAEAAAGQPRQRLWRIVARQAFLATGAVERPIVFGGNDRPGVMMASAVSAYVNRYAVAPGKRAVVFTTTDSGWTTAADLLAAGVEVAAVADARTALPEAARPVLAAGVEAFAGAVVSDVHGVPVRRVDLRTADGRTRRIAADLVAVAGGWNPAIGLAANLGHRPLWSDALGSFVIGEAPPGLRAVGAAAGRLGLGAALADGLGAARAAIVHAGRSLPSIDMPMASDDPCGGAPLWHVPSRRKAFVDFQHDVTDKDVALAAREGFVSVEHLKRYTTLGMATDQGKTSQVNGHALLAAATGKSIAEAGTIASRPPYAPVAIGALAGVHRDEHFRPARLTPSHDWAVEQGATFVDAGQWKRAQWYAQPGERDWLETVSREVRMTRGGVGLCDVSTLGKIEVHGPDAGRLLDRLYVNMFSTLPVGKARYGLMLREDGLVMDDGTTSRFAEDRFFVTTTTVNAARVMQHIDHARQVLWPELDVQATSVTEQWATYAVAGPLSRALLQTLLPGFDLSNAAFPYMAAAELRWDCGGEPVPARLYRLSFSGELAYEIGVPAHYGDRLVRALAALGRAHGIVPYGTEALGVMRIEKGHPAGAELNGQTTAADLGLGRMLSGKKDYIGRVMAQRPGLTDPARPALVGLKPVDRAARLRAGSHLLAPGAAPVAANDQGHVTSVAYSPMLGHWIGLALLRHGPERHGERIVLHDPVRGADVEAEVCHPVFFDPEGERVRG
jgi:methylglutamate dehydrogenase subunit C